MTIFALFNISQHSSVAQTTSGPVLPAPQATLLDLTLNPGDTHISLVPLPPVPPAPPVPSPVWASACSPVSMNLVGSVATISTHINSALKTGAKSIHVIPHVDALTLPPGKTTVPPGHDADCFMGAQFVTAGGKPAAKLIFSLYMTCSDPMNLPSAMALIPVATRLVIIGGGITVDWLALAFSMLASLLKFSFFTAFSKYLSRIGDRAFAWMASRLAGRGLGNAVTVAACNIAERGVAQGFLLVTLDTAKAVSDGFKNSCNGESFWGGFGSSIAQSATNRAINTINPASGAASDALVGGAASNLAQDQVNSAITGG